METIENREVVTRKEHRCFGCQRSYPAGSRLTKWAVSNDGGVNRGYNCATCDAIMQIYSNARSSFFAQDGFDRGFVREVSMTGETPEQCLERLKAAKPEDLL